MTPKVSATQTFTMTIRHYATFKANAAFSAASTHKAATMFKYAAFALLSVLLIVASDYAGRHGYSALLNIPLGIAYLSMLVIIGVELYRKNR